VLERGYQRCVVDPEGDYEDFPSLLQLGGVEHAPTVAEVATILAASHPIWLISLLQPNRIALRKDKSEALMSRY
jgi:hypothetical protein